MGEPLMDWAKRILVASAVTAVVVLLLWGMGALAQILLLFFGGLILAQLLRTLGSALAGHTALSQRWAILVALLALMGVLVGLGFWLIPRIVEQTAALPGELSNSFRQMGAFWQSHPVLKQVMPRDPAHMLPEGGRRVARELLGLFSTLLGILGGVAIVLFVGLYAAFVPEPYVAGAVRLVPQSRRRHARNLLSEVGHVLGSWLLGRMLSMTIVGVLTAVGLALVGMPLSISLGFMAGALSFIPNIGPVLSVLPALALAIPEGTNRVFWVLGIYAGVQTLESFAITPFIQRRAVSVPPVLLLFGQVAMGALAGVLGVLLATPLLACLIVIVKRWYVEGVLEGTEPE